MDIISLRKNPLYFFFTEKLVEPIIKLIDFTDCKNHNLHCLRRYASERREDPIRFHRDIIEQCTTGNQARKIKIIYIATTIAENGCFENGKELKENVFPFLIKKGVKIISHNVSGNIPVWLSHNLSSTEEAKRVITESMTYHNVIEKNQPKTKILSY